MRGFLGTGAPLAIDLALVSTLALFGVASWAAFLARLRRFPVHCRAMDVAALLNWVPVLAIMIRPWLRIAALGLGAFDNVYVAVPMLHGLTAAVAQLLMTYTVVRMSWLKQLPPRRTRWLMRITMGLWSVAAIGGLITYLVLYTL